MHTTSPLALLAGFLFALPAYAAPEVPKLVDLGKSDPRLKGYSAPEGLKVEIVAEAPVVINPAAMTFAADGTPLVLEWASSPGDEGRETPVEFKYKDGSKRTIVTLSKRTKDAIKVLSDTKGKGIYDEAKVVLEEELPSTILLHDGWLYTASRGSVRRWKQSKEDGPYDVKEIIAQGFGGFPHQVTGLTLGNDGWLYMSAGDGDHYAEGSDGKRATVLRTGAVFRCKPDGSKLEVYALGFRNPYGNIAFDAAFNLFHVDGDDENGCRLLHIVEGGDFGWRLRQGTRGMPDPVRAVFFGEQPGKMPVLLKTGRGAPGGLLICNETFFPEPYRGLLFSPDALRKLIRAYKVERQGASFKVVEEFEFLKSDDPLFRPCQMDVGPDGAMYVVDRRMDAAGMGKPWGDGKNGRIYRLTWAGTKEHPAIAPRGLDAWAKIQKQSEEELLKTLRSDNFTDRQVAQRELIRRGEKVRAGLLKLLEDSDAPSPARLAALGALKACWNEDVAKAVKEGLMDMDPDLRRLVIETLGMHGEARGVEAVGLLDDGDLDVRRAAVMAVARTASPGIADTLVNALLADESKDVLLQDSYLRAIEMVGKTGIERLVSVFESGEKKKINLVADLFLRLRTRPAAAGLPSLLVYPHLTIKQRVDLIRSYTHYLLDPPVSLEPLLDYLLKNPNEALPVKLAGFEVLSLGQALKGPKTEKWLLGLREDLPALKELLDTKEAGQLSLRRQALRAYGVLDPQGARQYARQLLKGGEEAMQADAVLLFGSDAASAKEVGRLFLDKQVARACLPEVLEVLRRHAKGDTEAADLLSRVMKTSGGR